MPGLLASGALCIKVVICHRELIVKMQTRVKHSVHLWRLVTLTDSEVAKARVADSTLRKQLHKLN